MTNPDLNALSEEEQFLAGLADDAPLPEDPPAETPPAETPPPAENPPGAIDTPENAGQPPSEEEDPALAALPEEIRNRLTKAESESRQAAEELARQRNDNAAMAGKIAPLQRRLAQLESAAPKPSTPSAPATVQTVEELDAQLETPEFKEWAATFPEEAKVWKANARRTIEIVDSRIAKAVEKITGRIEPTLGRLEQQQQKTDREERIAQLAAAHPDWEAHNASEDFSNWFNGEYLPSLPQVVQDQFKDPKVVARALSEPSYTIRVLNDYKRERGIEAAPPAPTPDPVETPAQSPKPSARLAMSASPNIKPNPPTTRVRLDLMTPEQQFQAGLNAPD